MCQLHPVVASDVRVIIEQNCDVVRLVVVFRREHNHDLVLEVGSGHTHLDRPRRHLTKADRVVERTALNNTQMGEAHVAMLLWLAHVRLK